MLLEDNKTNEQQVSTKIHKEADQTNSIKICSCVPLLYSSHFYIYKTVKAYNMHFLFMIMNTTLWQLND